MTTLLLSHDICIAHAPPEGHPERPDRLRAVNQVLADSRFDDLVREEAPSCSIDHISRAHPDDYIAAVEKAAPEEGLVQIDPDTYMNPSSLQAARHAAGAGVRAVDAVINREVENAFCAVRPPGHHAETGRAMGFCLFNSIAIAAYHALRVHGAERVAVVDFDVHHGNGTQEIFWSEPDVLFASSHQMPLFPGSGALAETGAGNIFNAPLRAGDGRDQFREAMQSRILPAVDTHQPDIILISAGFDAHRNDPLASLQLVEDDFAWITLHLMELAHKHCEGRIVSMLEGGYDLAGLAASVGAHVHALMRGTG